MDRALHLLRRLRRLTCAHEFVLVDSKVTEMATGPTGEPSTVQLILSHCQRCGAWDVLDYELSVPADEVAA